MDIHSALKIVHSMARTTYTGMSNLPPGVTELEARSALNIVDVLNSKRIVVEDNKPNIEDKPQSATPVGPGFWWAKTQRVKYPNAIVHVYGHAPFLNLIAWDIYTHRSAAISISDIEEWGPQIATPYDEAELCGAAKD